MTKRVGQLKYFYFKNEHICYSKSFLIPVISQEIT